eukprot:6945328-Pyramimonas_sp.AAC.2
MRRKCEKSHACAGGEARGLGAEVQGAGPRTERESRRGGGGGQGGPCCAGGDAAQRTRLRPSVLRPAGGGA